MDSRVPASATSCPIGFAPPPRPWLAPVLVVQITAVTQRSKTLHRPLMPLPSRSECSCLRSGTVKILSNLACSAPPKSLRALRRLQLIPATPCWIWLSPYLHSHQLTFLALLRPRGFAPPRRLFPKSTFRPCFMPVPSMGFQSFEGFSPPVAPTTSRSSVSSVPFSSGFAPPRSLRFEPSQPPSVSASRMSASAGCVAVAPRV